MKIKDYTEHKIRHTILSKVKPGKINKNTPHWKGYISINDKILAKVKIPNYHTIIMHYSKSLYIARDLRLTDEDFNRLIDCPMTRAEYYHKLAKSS
jgi:hypothetical protein